MTVLWVAGAATVTALALADCPFAVTGGTALVLAAACIAWEILTRQREWRRLREAGISAWTERELAALDDAKALVRLLDGLPEAPRGGILP